MSMPPTPVGSPPSVPSTTHLLQLLLTQMQDYAVALLDTEGRVTAWRGAAQETFGYTEAEIDRKSVV